MSQARGEAGGTPEFREIYDAIKAHSSISPAELNQAAVQGLLSELAPRVILVTNGSASRASATTPLVSKSSLMEGDIAYVRIERVGEGLPKAVREAWETLSHSNKLQGIVLDLRYADGSDYAAAAGTADLFLKKDVPLLNWGAGTVRSKEKPDPILVPAAVLVNHFTSEAAEALAAALRASGAGLILGRRTAGQAMVMQDFPLSNGDQLRIATAPVQLGDGAALSMHGVRPDITVEVTRDEERAYYADAFRLPGKTDLSASAGLSLTNAVGNTNRVARRPRFNEAELVRERREGLSEGDMTGAKDHEADKPVVYDPALARALDLLKGLAVVRQTRS
ncbi:MAG TPA: S41 family peptidase [Candidatus Acidoferrum sp.]|nr:S41 family peptidase [Candidatus Acidoferrum sp.]